MENCVSTTSKEKSGFNYLALCVDRATEVPEDDLFGLKEPAAPVGRD
jgi:hypothetical protein